MKLGGGTEGGPLVFTAKKLIHIGNVSCFKPNLMFTICIFMGGGK